MASLGKSFLALGKLPPQSLLQGRGQPSGEPELAAPAGAWLQAGLQAKANKGLSEQNPPRESKKCFKQLIPPEGGEGAGKDQRHLPVWDR